jgi:hypothetical protein
MQPDLTSFFDAYRDSFPRGPAAIASFYAEPSIAARAGVVRVSTSHGEMAALMSAVDQQYRSRGFTHATYEVSDVRGLGANSALATLRWTYRNATGDALWQTTFSYNLYRRENGWKILVQTMHDM